MSGYHNVEEAEEIIGYHFDNQSFLIEALSAPGSGLSRDGNRRLAQLGDSVMKTVLLDGLYLAQDERCERRFILQRNYSNIIAATGQELLNRVGENQFLAKVASKSGLDVLVVLNNSQRGQPPSPSLLKATMGAVIGAVWLDSKRDVPTLQTLIRRIGYVATTGISD